MEQDIRNPINKAEEVHSRQPQRNGRDSAPSPSSELNLDEVKDRHRDLRDEVARLAELKRKAVAGELEALVYEAELREVADKYKKEQRNDASQAGGRR